MSSRPSLRIARPYETVEAFLDGDAWTVDRADMILVGAEALAENASVRFEIVLTSGIAVVTGEGRVVEHVPARDERPAGLRVRFQKLDGASKAVLKRALEAQKRAGKGKPLAPAAASSPEAASSPTQAEPPLSPAEPAQESVQASARSGVRHALGPVSAPENREALLERLRQRAKTVQSDMLLAGKRSTAAE